MTTHDKPSRELDEAVRHAGTAWRDHGCRIPEQGPARRAVRTALMDARRTGASWRILSNELGIDPADLRDQAGCMPRFGEKPAPGERRQGRGAGHPGRHESNNPEGHEHRGCGEHGDHDCEGDALAGCEERSGSECGVRHRERRRARGIAAPGR